MKFYQVLLFGTAFAAASVTGAVVERNNGSGSPLSAKCSSFKVDKPDFVELKKATYYPANAQVSINQTGGPLFADDLPAFCRLELVIQTDPSAGQSARAEVWLPTENYNKRTLALGNGGYAGIISYKDLAGSGLRNGFAAVSTNTGHDANAPDGPTGKWALNNPPAVIDFAYRALHMSTVAAKEIVERFYGEKAKKSYYSGCSTGGRQGLTEAQYYPDDFDGILAGSPAAHFSHLQVASGIVRNFVGPVNGSSWLTDNDWALIGREVLKQCDEIDGVKDKVIQNPRNCHFRPEAIACDRDVKKSTCLTRGQIAALHKIYSPIYETGSTYIFPGLEPGFEDGYAAFFGAGLFPYPGIWLSNFVYNTSTPFDVTRITYEDIQKSDQVVLPQLNMSNFDIRAFQDKGGKLLTYHGFADQLIQPENAINTYNEADLIMKKAGRNLDDVLKFYTVPGMAHCSGGSGANGFGAFGHTAGSTPALKAEPKYDMLLALVDWVENGKAPGEIIATHWKNNNKTQGVDFTRPLCKYPAQSKYKGKGDASKAENWYCAYPPPF